MSDGTGERAPTSGCGDSGLTVSDVARRLRVSEDKVRAWIGRGELAAVNTADSKLGRPRWVVRPEALERFMKGRAGGPAPKPPKRKKRTSWVDYYPD